LIFDQHILLHKITGEKMYIGEEQRIAFFIDDEKKKKEWQKKIKPFFPKSVAFYQKISELAKDIILNKIYGVLFITKKGSGTVSNIWNYMKKIPGWNWDRALEFPLPHIIDFGYNSLKFSEATSLITQMMDGDFYQKVRNEFILERHLSWLRLMMSVPKEPITIMIVDDMPDQIYGPTILLEIWPNVTLNAIKNPHHHLDRELVDKILEEKPNILLLDEAMGHIKGTQIAQMLKEKGFQGIFASITAGRHPNYTDHIFSKKGSVPTNEKSAKKFIEFVNMLIKKMP
jgi:CheY-like chemotaxis protein